MKIIDDLVTAHRSLRECDSVGALFARAAELGSKVCGFERGVIAIVSDGHLTSLRSPAMADERCDALRRLLLASPLPLSPESDETELIRRGARQGSQHATSLLAEFLGLEAWAFSPVVPESTALALVVFDRPGPPVAPDDLSAVDAFAIGLSVLLANMVLRRRAADLAEEVRQFTGSAQALAREMLDAPVTLPVDHGFGPALPRAEMAGQASDASLMAVLSERERRIAELLVEGRSNREIAEILVISPETVKTHVARILRKLGAANRVEAVSRLLRLSA